MEGKTMILSVLLLSLVVAQIYNTTRVAKCSKESCATLNGSGIANRKCPIGCTLNSQENAGGDINEYCKVGCVSSVCFALATVQTSDASEIMNELYENCAKGCSTVCTEGSMNAVETD